LIHFHTLPYSYNWYLVQRLHQLSSELGSKLVRL